MTGLLRQTEQLQPFTPLKIASQELQQDHVCHGMQQNHVCHGMQLGRRVFARPQLQQAPRVLAIRHSGRSAFHGMRANGFSPTTSIGEDRRYIFTLS